MDTLRLFAHILTNLILIIFYGIPAIVVGIQEWNGVLYSKRFCVFSIAVGILMCIIGPFISIYCWY